MDKNDPRWNDDRVTNSSGNVFLDLGFSPAEATVLTFRTELMVRLKKMIKQKRWTQTQAAEILGIAQSRVSDLTRGKHDRFSVDMLLTLAARAGLNPQIKWVA
ncbi:MAG: helix-turn-helix transcriptional regulator [Planctomycetota bacterium]